jgi:hypothetical protein
LHNDLSSKTAFLSNPNFQLKPYTCLRLFWKVFKDPTLEHSRLFSIDNMNSDGSKGYYLCKGNEVQVFECKDLEILRKNSSETITQRIWGNRKATTLFKEERKAISGDVTMTPNLLQIKQEEFWESLIKFFISSRPKFTMKNIDFRFKTFTVEEKFPVQFWNTAQLDTKDKLLLSVESHWKLAQSYDQVEKTTFSSDQFLENVIKINHGKERISSLFLTKGASNVKVKSKPNIAKGSDNEDEYGTITDQKNLPMSMRYRRYRDNPKKVCVGASKIHCQGLFALEHFSQGDIIIEYVGEIIDNTEADRREKYYEQSGMSD